MYIEPITTRLSALTSWACTLHSHRDPVLKRALTVLNCFEILVLFVLFSPFSVPLFLSWHSFMCLNLASNLLYVWRCIEFPDPLASTSQSWDYRCVLYHHWFEMLSDFQQMGLCYGIIYSGPWRLQNWSCFINSHCNGKMDEKAVP